MAYLFKRRAKSYDTSFTSGQYSDDVDNALCEFAGDLLDCGWDVGYRYHFAYVQTNAEMSHFGGNHILWQVIPPPDYAGLIPIIIDERPPGYNPPPTHYIFRVTGTTDIAVTHQAVIDCMMSFDGRIVNYGTNLADPFPNTLLGWEEWPSFAASRQPLHANREPFGGPAVALHTNILTGLSRGGYVARCQPNGNPDNFTSLFISRNDVGGINPHQPIFYFAKSFPDDQPVINFSDGLVVGTSVSSTVTIDYTRSDALFAIGPNHCLMAQAVAPSNGHLATAALSLPILDGPDVTVAVFGIGGGVGGATFGFRTALQASANNGAIYLNINGIERFDFGSPTSEVVRVMNLWLQNDGLKWENGLAQVQEPWLGFQSKVGTTLPSATLGKLPGAIVTTGAFNADTAPVRKWDGSAYRAFTHNNVAGTLWFRSDEVVADPACTVSE